MMKDIFYSYVPRQTQMYWKSYLLCKLILLIIILYFLILLERFYIMKVIKYIKSYEKKISLIDYTKLVLTSYLIFVLNLSYWN